ncbi:MAG: sugar transferase [Bacteroidales bacterium]|nr:sugar transferase [Bacteroidales bacterium]
MKRFFDLTISIPSLVLFSPFMLLIFVAVVLDSRGGLFYKQVRVGKDNRDFRMYKFRSMKQGADKEGLLTTNNHEQRITKTGRFLRKWKLDEIPQLINIIKGEMSLVGPRPEVRKYVDLYTPEQMHVLSVLPGLTDYASLVYINETELLSSSSNAEQTYIQEIMPAKLKLNFKYINEQSLSTDIRIILKTIQQILFN